MAKIRSVKNSFGSLGIMLGGIFFLFLYFFLSHQLDAFLIFFKILISLPLIFFIPGLLCVNAFALKEVNFRFSEIVFVQVLISIVISSVFGILLAGAGIFSLLNLSLLLLGFCATLCLIKEVRWTSFTKPIFNAEAISLISIFGLALVLLALFPPAEWLIGTWDCGVYMNNGVNIARTGSIVVHDPLISAVNQDAVFATHGTHCFAPIDPKKGEFIPLLYHLFPVWIAIFYSVFGILGVTYVAPFFGMMGILSVFMVARQITNWNVAFIGSLLLSLNFVQLFFSRTPYTEVMVQFLIFSGMFAFIIYKECLNNKFAVISAITLSLSLLVRIDSYILLIPFFGYYFYLKLSNNMKDHDMIFANAFLISSILNTLYIIQFSSIYTEGILRGVIGKVISGPIVADLAKTSLHLLIVICCIFLVYINFEKLKTSVGFGQKIILVNDLRQNLNDMIEDVDRYIHRNKPTLGYIISFLIAIFVIYNWVIRPLDAAYTSYAYSLSKLAWYLSPLILICGVVGSIILINNLTRGKDHKRSAYYLLGLFLLFFIIYTININHSPYVPLMLRRYLPIVIPTLMICAGYCIYYISELLTQKKIFQQLIVIVVVSIVIFGYAQDDSLLKQKMWDGIPDTTTEISQLVDDDIIIFGDGPDRLTAPGRILASPMKYIYGKNVLFIDDANGANIIAILRSINNTSVKLYGENKKIYVSEFDVVSISNEAPDIDFIEVARFTVPYKVLGGAVDRVPSEMSNFTKRVSIYEVNFGRDPIS
ncbi:hypothetical protein [Methanoculleus sp.]|uniref:hypothetical protein n=1 Tax=Methanoculleus sp. TaxID=90427 RepID=UPI001BD3D3ED|nr:hypothetical protein [Methanoculleus sp.]